MENYEIELTEGLKDPEKAKEAIKKVQKVIDDLIESNEEFKEAALKSHEIANEYMSHAQVLSKVVLELTNTIKTINVVLATKKDMFGDDKEIKVLMDSMADFVLSSGPVKAGIISNE